MLDLFAIFTKGGIALWAHKPQRIQGTPINDLIVNVMIEGKEDYASGRYGFDKTFDPEHEVFFVAVFQKSFQHKLAYVPLLLSKVKEEFIKEYSGILEDLKGAGSEPLDFDARFKTIQKWAEQNASQQQPKKPRAFETTEKYQTTLAHNTKLQAGTLTKQTAEEPTPTELPPVDPGSMADDDVQARLAKMGRMRRSGKSPSKSPRKGAPTSPTSKKSPKKPKEARSWAGGAAKGELVDYSNHDQKVDGSNTDGTSDMSTAEILRLRAQAKHLSGDLPEIEYESSDEEGEDDASGAAQGKKAASTSGFFGSLMNMLPVGSSTVTKEALEPALDKMRLHLIDNNVASEIAAQLCDSVGESLIGKSKSTFKGVQSIVKSALETTLAKILSPNRRLDILRDVIAANQAGRPYSFVFCGVNGVGKSTNLSKVAFWLMSNKKRVLMAACDTFRAGAVEQLRTHCRKLNALLPADKPLCALFEKGYGKDDAGIAQEAIACGADLGFDVVLVDTAGRMQNNGPLMRSLAKLIKVNQPDLILFVGEALVGNEAVDQLVKFDQALVDNAEGQTPRTLDGILLTKFDAVDNKVGAAISMSYISKQPIVFVGCGQDYPDLRKLNVKSVVSQLLK